MGVVVRRYIDILTIIINFPYSTCISSFFGSSIPTSLFIFKMFFRSLYIDIQYIYLYPWAVHLVPRGPPVTRNVQTSDQPVEVQWSIYNRLENGYFSSKL